MASLERRGSTYRLVFVHDGRRHQVALKTDNRKRAETLRGTLEANLGRLQLGELEAPQGVDLGAWLLTDGRSAWPTGGAEKPTTLGDLLSRHRAARGAANEANTLRTEAIHATHLVATFGEGFPVRTLTTSDLQRHVDRRSGEAGRAGLRVSPVTVRKEVQTFSSAWNWGAAMGLLSGRFPSRGLVYPKGQEKPPFMTLAEITRRSAGLPADEAEALWECLFLTKDEVRELLGLVRDANRPAWVHPMMFAAAHTGARRSELLRARVGDFDLVGGAVWLRERKRDRARRTSRRVPLTPTLSAVMATWLASRRGDFAFCNPDGSPVTVPASNHQWDMAVRGTPWARARGWHVLRHSFASNCAAAGVDQRRIDAWMGHQNPATAARYRHLIPTNEVGELSSVFD